MESNFFGFIKGEQPLIHESSASKSLAVFWFSFGGKREHYCAFFKNSGSCIPICASALPRWLMASFSSGVSWA